MGEGQVTVDVVLRVVASVKWLFATLYSIQYCTLWKSARVHTRTRTRTHTLSVSPPPLPHTFLCFWKPVYQKAYPWTIIGNPISVDKCIILCWMSASFPLWSVFTLNIRLHITNECPVLMFSLNMMYRNFLHSLPNLRSIFFLVPVRFSETVRVRVLAWRFVICYCWETLLAPRMTS